MKFESVIIHKVANGYILENPDNRLNESRGMVVSMDSKYVFAGLSQLNEFLEDNFNVNAKKA